MFTQINSQPDKTQIHARMETAGVDERYIIQNVIRNRDEYVDSLEIWPLYINGKIAVNIQLVDHDGWQRCQATVPIPSGTTYPGVTTLLERAVGQLNSEPQVIPIKLNYSGRIQINVSSDDKDNQVMLILKNSLQSRLKS